MFKKIVLVYGGPGSGKGTLADFLTNNQQPHGHPAWHKCSMSTSLSEVDHTFVGLNIMSTMEQGGIVDDDIVIPTFHLKLAQHVRLANKGDSLVFEGGLRRLTQVKKQIELACMYAHHVLIAKLKLDDQTMLMRILNRKRGRSDDVEHTIRNRISEFRESEEKITKCAERLASKSPRGKVEFIEIEADQTPETVASFILHPRRSTLPA